jgi:hypothetical protein
MAEKKNDKKNRRKSKFESDTTARPLRKGLFRSHRTLSKSRRSGMIQLFSVSRLKSGRGIRTAGQWGKWVVLG